MFVINLDPEIKFLSASMRIFKKGERHITRYLSHDVLILLFEGVLRFTENGEEYEIYPGEYFIQKGNSYQDAVKESDEPKYLYIHLKASWQENGNKVLQRRGKFDIDLIKPISEAMDKYCHENYTRAEILSKFYEILSILYKKSLSESETARKIRKYIELNYLDNITLTKISKEFSFSKNHIINIFKKEYGLTPFEYMNLFKIKKCEYLLEVTGESIENIAYNCGFNNYSQFFRLFVKKNNMTPKEYRILKSYK